jgi:hypothetical protein
MSTQDKTRLKYLWHRANELEDLLRYSEAKIMRALYWAKFRALKQNNYINN